MRARPSLLASLLVLAAALTAWSASAPGAAAQEPSDPAPEPVRVVVRELPPFVERTADGGFTGFTVELWEEVAGRAGLDSEYLTVSSVGEQLDAVTGGEADVGATVISITDDREARLDFSYPYFQSGLQVMVPADTRVSFLGAVRRSGTRPCSTCSSCSSSPWWWWA